MAYAENKITINRPVSDVFAFVLDGDNNSKWRPGVLDIQRLTSKPDGVGSKFKQGLKGPGGRIDGDYEITECEPNKSIQFQVTAGPARPMGSYSFEASGNATTLTFVLHFEPKGLQKLMNGIITRTMQSEVATLSNLKAYLEGH